MNTPVPVFDHKKICITFELEGRLFEAVGFLEAGEELSEEEILRRVADKNNGAIGRDDTDFISEHLHNLPQELRRYYLITGCFAKDKPRYLVHFFFCVNSWHKSRGWSSQRRGFNHLVVRRVV